MCLNGGVVKVLVSYFDFSIVTWFKFVSRRSLDTSTVSFLLGPPEKNLSTKSLLSYQYLIIGEQ